MPQEFISEAIKPVEGTFDTKRMAVGEPGLPREFIWRGTTYKIKEVLTVWKETGPCTHGSKEMYVRRHYYEVLTETGETMKIYFERQPPRGKPKSPRWWLFSKA
ncbi:MAG TPA: DUF6504 family protein [Candidatus Omnitrophota bacterium]|nr:DUF6504 family protein [Candidatus Omnitrophota bacterium]HPD85252.1 DUF6504 family protein [Candidatus Omnitrophota bacterium]HRZ04247.1 DUF6504 family protein [Candidatus Omnitrophota bacterium]